MVFSAICQVPPFFLLCAQQMTILSTLLVIEQGWETNSGPYVVSRHVLFPDLSVFDCKTFVVSVSPAKFESLSD